MKPGPQEYEAMVKANVWHSREELDLFVAVIKRLSDERKFTPDGNFTEDSNRWSWARNGRCKYVTLHIDMRDGGFVLQDRNGERISLDQLRYQWTPDEVRP
jgi:hypothetical protein